MPVERDYLTIRIDPNLNKAVEHACTDRGVSKQKAVIEALEAWLRKSVNPEAPYCENSIANQKIPLKIENSPSTGGLAITQQEAQWIARVLEILRRGPRIACAALESNLEVFSYLSQLVGSEPQAHVSPGSTLPDTPADLQTTLERLRENQTAIDRELAKPFPFGGADSAEGETATGTGGPTGPRRKPDKGSSGGRG